MKKCFLLISIILVAFGFSLNSNVISNSFENNNINNTKQISNKNEIIIGYTEDDKDILDVTTTSNTATIHYTVTSSSGVAITELKYSIKDPDKNEIKGIAKTQDELRKDEKNDDDTSTHFYEGDITIEDLIPNTTYSSVVITGTDGKNPPDSYTSNNDANYTFTTKEVIFTNTVETSPGTGIDDDGNITGSATASYEIYNSPEKITKIEWVNYDNGIDGNWDDFVLASSEPPENESGNPNDGYNYNGSLTVDGLCSGSYDNTSLIIDGGIESKINSFTIENITKMGTVTATDLTEVNSTTEEVTYTIDPAKKWKWYNNDITVNPTKIVWIDEDNSNELSSIEWDDENSWNESGSITAKNLAPKEYNNTKLVVTDELGMTYEGAVETFTITDEPEEKPTTITADKNGRDKTVYDIGQKEASINYTIDPGTDIDGNKLTVSTVEWYDGNDNPFKGATNNDKKTTGTLTAKDLTPGTTYEDTYLQVMMSDGNKITTNEGEIENFKTDNGDFPGKVEQKEKTEISTTMNSATIEYEINPALNVNGGEIPPENIEWYQEKDKEEDIFLGSDKPKKENDEYSGEITANDLPPNTPYANTYLIVDKGSPNEYKSTIKIKTFTTDEAGIEGEIKANTPNPGVYYATVTYSISRFGTDVDGGSYEPAKVRWTDNEGNDLGNGSGIDDDPPNELNEEHTITVHGLDPFTKYEDTKLIATDDTGQDYETTINDFTTLKGDITPEINDNGVKVKGDKATIKYTITPGKDDKGKELKYTKVTWYDEDDNELISEVPTSYNGELTIENLPLNTLYENTYLILEYEGNYAVGDNTEGITSSKTKNTTEINGIVNEWISGNFKTKKMIMGGSILGIFVIIFAIVGFFFWAYKKRRRVN